MYVYCIYVMYYTTTYTIHIHSKLPIINYREGGGNYHQMRKISTYWSWQRSGIMLPSL